MTLDEVLRALIKEAVREEVRGARSAMPEATQTRAASEYLTAAEAAGVASVTQATIRRWVRDGKLRRCSAGRGLRIARGDLDNFLRLSSPSGPDDPKAVALRLVTSSAPKRGD